MKSYYVQGGSGTRLYVEEDGNPRGRPILFIHGFTQCRLSWKKQMKSSLGRDFRLVALDLRGHGLSEKPVGGYELSINWADDVQGIIEELELKNPLLVGSSYGGIVISDYIRCYGDAFISGINFVGAFTALGTKDASSFFTSEGRSLKSGLLSEFTEESIQGMLSLMDLCFYRQPPQEDVCFILGCNLLTPPFVRQMILSRKVSSKDVLGKIKKPVLITHGTDDRIVRVEAASYIKELIPQARLSLYPKSGHLTFWENARRFNSELKKFYESII